MRKCKSLFVSATGIVVLMGLTALIIRLNGSPLEADDRFGLAVY